MSVLGLVIRWTHLTSSVFVVGAGMILLLAGRSDRPTARVWERGIQNAARVLVLLALVSGFAQIAHQTALLTGRPSAALEPKSLGRVLFDTQAGRVWLIRYGLLLLLATFLVLRANVERHLDWFAARAEAALLAVGALALLSGGGHAAAVEPGTATALAIDSLHLLATGVWMGGLPALALLLYLASREPGADARPFAVVTTRRFSRLALASVLVLGATGVVNAISQIGSVAGVVGTPYGRLLLVKLGLLAPILVVAAANRSRLVPALSGDGVTVGRPAMRRLARFVVTEAALGLALLGIVAVMTATPPARHEQPAWPFPFRLSAVALDSAPAAKWRVLAGSQILVLGVVGALSSRVVRSRRRPMLLAAAALGAIGLVIALPPLVVDAYPTTYYRSPVPYDAASITGGATLYRAHCVGCHRTELASTRPHTIGDIFWWVTHGVPGTAMPGFAALSDAERWDIVNFVRARAAAEAARSMGTTVDLDHPWLVAPDFTFSVGPTPARALRDYRGRRIVLVVLYSLPGSRPRLVQLAENYDVLSIFGVEVIAVPADGAGDAIRRLGGKPPIFFPIATDGAPEIVATYGLFAPGARHAEFLIDRNGYLRARGVGESETRAVGPLLAEIEKLNAEKTIAAPADEHVH